MIEMLIGIAFAGFILAIPYVYERVGGKLSLGKLSLGMPKLRSKKEVEEKIKEVDRELEEVVNAGVSINPKPAEEKVVPLDDANVEPDDNLLEEMETASEIKVEAPEPDEEKLPDIPDLPELNSDLDMDFEDLGQEIPLDADEQEEEEEEEEVEEVEFDEEDDLISSLAKEVETKEEEEIDLLRDLKGQKFSAEELEAELQEMIQRLKVLSGGSS
ncbi:MULTISPECIES: hypothetical protein [Archaeoglobus]|jgi:pilus assembly protein FimV|uniref:Uncharacterized protein AF_1047 n=2 Tax=Archaeoglobus fulgidus TaxID=2234 RepID=Y1047_ARCFU|nr:MULTISPECIES: hypothetical protein [Archaeoglobus]O29215.1 RecName: Full=Uncharacterized protein AF_1047 [Archaeoglobus fulgidus DSM 4304]AAB90195.1 predicted coding region AF_1047 [Archaeoglobus fulgidus DSM 4304]AIG97925.1 hypothetical protein AFULGI_00011440 [Archaeoglobus fulgidus DSM 8774]MDI3497507.1 hypothetical protein [Archaeoglobus sp.]